MDLQYLSRRADPVGAFVFVLALTACGSSVRFAPEGVHPANAKARIVDRPPPPAQIEGVLPDPGEPCVWLDGRWEWYGQRWEWNRGRWVVAPEGCSYAAPIAVWAQSGENGQLVHTPGRWYSEQDGSPCTKAKYCALRASSTQRR